MKAALRILALAIGLNGTLPVSAAELRGELRVAPSVGFDSNPNRDYDNPALVGGPFGALALQGSGDWRSEALVLRAGYEAGGRAYAFPGHVPLFTQALTFEGLTRWGGAVFGFEGRIRDRRGLRAYTDLLGGGVAELPVASGAMLRLRLSAHRFIYTPVFDESFTALEGGASLRWRIDRSHAVSVSIDDSERIHVTDALRASGERSVGHRRRDRLFTAQAAWSFRGPFAAGVGYLFALNASNSAGQRLSSHRFTAHAGVRVPFDAMLFAQASVAFTRYLDGVFLSGELPPLQDDDENTNAVSLKLVRPVSPAIDVELRAGLYAAQFSNHPLQYLRGLVSAGLSFRY